MSIPKTSKLSLIKIIENLDRIPANGFGQEPPSLSPDQKRQLQEMAAMFNEYGKEFENEQNIMDSAKAISEFMSLAETYAVNEGNPDWFQKDIVQKDFQNAKKKVMEFTKLAQECYATKQKLGVLFDDLRHVVNRYYKIQPNAPAPDQQ